MAYHRGYAQKILKRSFFNGGLAIPNLESRDTLPLNTHHVLNVTGEESPLTKKTFNTQFVIKFEESFRHKGVVSEKVPPFHLTTQSL